MTTMILGCVQLALTIAVIRMNERLNDLEDNHKFNQR